MSMNRGCKLPAGNQVSQLVCTHDAHVDQDGGTVTEGVRYRIPACIANWTNVWAVL